MKSWLPTFAVALAVSTSAVRGEIVSFQQGANLTGTVTPYTGTVDTWLEGAANWSGNPNGYVTSGPTRAYVLRFENIIGAGTGQIKPHGTGGPGYTTQVLNATLSFTGGAHLTPGPLQLHRVLVPWTPGPSNTMWGNGTAFPTPVTQITGPVAVGQDALNQTFDVTSVVQAWVDGTDNFGLFVQQQLAGRSHIVFTSSHATLANRPLLTVEFAEFAPPLAPEPASLLQWAAVLGVAGAGWHFRRRRQTAAA